MPTDVDLPEEGMIYQREQYEKGGIGRRYWDYKDDQAIKHVTDRDVIVDIGCGEGILLEKLVKAYPEKSIFGIDAEVENHRICQQHGLDVRLESVYQLSLEDDSVDCVIFSEVIEHLDQPELALREISRVLKKGGLLILVFPNDFTFKLYRIILLMFKEAFYDTGHVKQWLPSDVRVFLRQFGLEAVEQRSLPFHFWPLSLHHMVVAENVFSSEDSYQRDDLKRITSRSLTS